MGVSGGRVLLELELHAVWQMAEYVAWPNGICHMSCLICDMSCLIVCVVYGRPSCITAHVLQCIVWHAPLHATFYECRDTLRYLSTVSRYMSLHIYLSRYMSLHI